MRYSDRICSAEETFDRVAPLLHAYGVTRLARQTGLDRLGIPVWNAIRPNSLSLAVNTGKGISDADAKISAAMEALERAVAGKPERTSRTASRAELHAEGRISDALDSLTGQGKSPLKDGDVADWIEGYDLIARRPVWVPLHALMLDRTMQTRFWQSSDGLASGNMPLEATFHGLLERIERDAEVLWSFAKSAERARRCIDPALFRDPVIHSLVERVRNAGLRLRVFDITSDIGVACFQALIGPDDIGRRRAVLYAEAANGSGCHPDPVRALIRAITEAAQSRLTLVSGSRDDISAETYARPMPQTLIEDFGLEPAGHEEAAQQSDDRPLAGKLAAVLDRLRHRSIPSVIAVPLNALDSPFAVVKVLVPALENPPGARKTRFGPRAFARMTRLV